MFEQLFTQVSESPEIQAYIQRKRFSIFKQIHEIVFYGKGGYDYDTVYHMPIWLRKYTFHELSEHYEKEAAALKGKSNSSTVSQEKQIARGPGIRQADYTVPRKV